MLRSTYGEEPKSVAFGLQAGGEPVDDVVEEPLAAVGARPDQRARVCAALLPARLTWSAAVASRSLVDVTFDQRGGDVPGLGDHPVGALGLGELWEKATNRNTGGSSASTR